MLKEIQFGLISSYTEKQPQLLEVSAKAGNMSAGSEMRIL